MDLLEPEPKLELDDPEWPILTPRIAASTRLHLRDRKDPQDSLI